MIWLCKKNNTNNLMGKNMPCTKQLDNHASYNHISACGQLLNSLIGTVITQRCANSSIITLIIPVHNNSYWSISPEVFTQQANCLLTLFCQSTTHHWLWGKICLSWMHAWSRLDDLDKNRAGFFKILSTSSDNTWTHIFNNLTASKYCRMIYKKIWLSWQYWLCCPGIIE